jgi:ribosomal protein S12 methylthiotransferase
MTTIGLVSLGCAKNLVDSEMILGMFEGGAYAFTDDPAKADVLIVNTCGFIDEAKKESIETILRLSAGSHAKLVVTGCFVERNLDELRKSLPEVALWIPLSAYATMNETLGRFLGTDDLKPLNPLRRVLDGNEAMAYLRISEGCDNYCSFCAIPFIRGRLVSRPLPEIAEEAHILLAKGIQEIDVVSQDPLHYGKDRPETGETLLKLLKTIDDMGFRAVRLLYLYPDEITDEELLFIKDSKTILPYFDIPIQS